MAKNATVTAVSATVTAVGVSPLVGNPSTKDFEVGKQVASFGPNQAWRIYEGRSELTDRSVMYIYICFVFYPTYRSFVF